MKSGKARKEKRKNGRHLVNLHRGLLLMRTKELSMPSFWGMFSPSKHKKRKIARGRNTTRKPVSECLSEGTGKGMPVGTDERNRCSDIGDECSTPRFGNVIKIIKEVL